MADSNISVKLEKTVSDEITKESKCQGTWCEQVENIANGSRRSTKEVNRCLTSCSGREKLVRNKRRLPLGLVGGGSALKPQVTASKPPLAVYQHIKH